VSKTLAAKIIKICQSFSKSQSIMLEMLFDVFPFILIHISLVLFSPGSAETDVGKVEYWTIIWWPVVPKIFILKIIKIGYPFFKWQSIMFGMFFPDKVYLQRAKPKHKLMTACSPNLSNRINSLSRQKNFQNLLT